LPDVNILTKTGKKGNRYFVYFEDGKKEKYN